MSKAGAMGAGQKTVAKNTDFAESNSVTVVFLTKDVVTN